MPKELFQCEICGVTHTTREYAITCENSHMTAEIVIESNFDKNDNKGRYPKKVLLEMANGKRIWFNRA